MSGKIQVPVVAIGGYFAFVVIGSLLVGILPPLVNKPTCKDKTESKLASFESNPIIEEIRHENVIHKKVPTLSEKVSEKLKREKREISPDRMKRMNELRESYPQRAETNEFVRARYTPKYGNYTICSEILFPQPGVLYPWYLPRLTDKVVPKEYIVEFYIPELNVEIFDGYSVALFEVLEPTNWVIVHNKLNLPFFEALIDDKGNKYEVDCLGEYFDNERFVIKFKQQLQPTNGPFAIAFLFISFLDQYESGLFEFEFGEGDQKSSMVISKFEPIDARKAFPCFDEPNFKASFNITIDHPNDTIAVFNTPKITDTEFVGVNNSIRTSFKKTPRLPTYLLGLAVFRIGDFLNVPRTLTLKSGKTIPVNLWARKKFINGGFGADPADMAIKILNALDLEFSEFEEALPEKIDILASPDYSIDAVPHLGFPIFLEKKILFKKESANEKDLQNFAFLMAKQFAEIYFGNYVTFGWWDELWLQEAFGDYVKYRALDIAYPEWQIYDQFVTEELIYVLVEDGYPSSHPISKPVNSALEIDEYFDSVESSKTAAIIRMMESETSKTVILNALKSYLSANKFGTGKPTDFLDAVGNIRTWSARDFMDRWAKQANYPILDIKITISNSLYYLTVDQDRALNSEYTIFADDLLYPSPYNFTWYVPLTCAFGYGPSEANPVIHKFNIQTKSSQSLIGDGTKMYDWVHCDRDFAGYFVIDYTKDNWINLRDALKLKNPNFSPLDRANIIHNAFVNAFTERNTYEIAVDVLEYLGRENDYIPWKTAIKHLTDLISVLDYKRSFYQVSGFFRFLLNEADTNLDLWNPTGNHTQDLKNEAILEMACRLQDTACLRNASEYWNIALSSLLSGSFNNSLPPIIRPTVYNYHFQNTYDVNEFDILIREYDITDDLLEHERYLEALTFVRLPWLLSDFIESQKDGRFMVIDFFDAMRYLARNQLGREIAWDYIRINWDSIVKFYGLEDPRLGHLVLDIASTFENEFLFYELLEFVFYTQSGASANARFKAIEIVSTNTLWLIDKEQEIIKYFGSGKYVEQKKSSQPEPKLATKEETQINRLKLKAKLTKAIDEISHREGFSIKNIKY